MARSIEQQQQIMILTIFLLLLLCCMGSLSASTLYHPAGSPQYQFMDVKSAPSASRRELSPFQLCLQCQCCAANDASNCAEMPCCFGIACNLPDKPYGVCAFVPKSCNCTSCN